MTNTSKKGRGRDLFVALIVLACCARAQDPATASAPPPQPAAQQGSTPAPRAPGGAPPSNDAQRMGSPPALPQGMSEQQMWPAATEEGWKKPVLIPWQRSFDDALRVARATKRPILVAVNMDGEIASEHYAGVRYRELETSRLFEPYVCIVASVYRHTPRDYDEQGRRVLCPRLGGVTCGEHIAAETELYGKYFEGARISPRHLVLEPDGTKTFDVYFSWDTATVMTTLRKGAENRPPPVPMLRDDARLVDRTQSPDVHDRDTIETEYLKSSPDVRRALLDAVQTQHVVDQVDLLRLAIFGLDVDLARVARRALAQAGTEGAVDLIAEALKVPLAADERALLIAAAERLAAKYPRARTLTTMHQGLTQSSKWIDAARLPALEYETRARAAGASGGATDGTEVAAGASGRAAGAGGIGARLEARAADSSARPRDANSQLELAEALLARAQDPATERSYAKLLVADARASAQAARALGAQGWRLEVVLAVAADLSGEDDDARTRAVAAVEGGMLAGSVSSDAVLEPSAVRVLALFARARQAAIRAAYRANQQWPPEWLSDVNAAYAVLARHPLATDEHLVSFYDFLRWLGGTPRANKVLDDALARFPGSALAHDRLRARLLWESGADGLEAAYTALLSDAASAELSWFAGYASLVAAEHHRRNGAPDKALPSYARGIEHYEAWIARGAGERANADHFIALALAGRARLALERGDLELATQELLACFARAPGAGATPDGLNITPVETAKMLRAGLESAQRVDLLAKLQTALDALDPKLLEKRAYELEDPMARRRNQREARRGDTPAPERR